jgi:cation:H+ antiporter
VFTAYVVHLVRKQVTATEQKQLKAEVEELEPTTKRPNAWICIAFLTAGVLLLAGGAQATVTGASNLARLLGWSETVIGLTIVSAGTGLPEVMASLVSSIRGRSDVAIGNVIGSNLFNILCILGLSGLVSPLQVAPELIASDCWWMLGLTALLLPIIFTGRKVTRWEGATLLSIYCLYVGLLLKSQT